MLACAVIENSDQPAHLHGQIRVSMGTLWVAKGPVENLDSDQTVRM